MTASRVRFVIRTKARSGISAPKEPLGTRLDLPDVFRTLGIERFLFRHQMQKLYTLDIMDRFEGASHPAIRSELARSGHEDWTSEAVT